jgi:hypothetical protein
MAIVSIRKISELAAGSVLAPERYDLRRNLFLRSGAALKVANLVTIKRRTVRPGHDGNCLVLDTSDALEGIIVARKAPVIGAKIGSHKKVVCANDVIISRLRPYLRQVAFVDEAIPGRSNALTVCSTEFFVLRGLEDEDIAFLVPYLLSPPVQSVLLASQEGGHHPRFSEEALLNLPLPKTLLKQRELLSRAVHESIARYRMYQNQMQHCIDSAAATMRKTLVPHSDEKTQLQPASATPLRLAISENVF